MLAQERYDLIARVLTEKNSIKVSEVMKLCNISHETARRDLEALQEQGLAKRVHGGAVIAVPSGNASTAGASNYSQRSYSSNMSVAKAALLKIREHSHRAVVINVVSVLNDHSGNGGGKMGLSKPRTAQKKQTGGHGEILFHGKSLGVAQKILIVAAHDLKVLGILLVIIQGEILKGLTAHKR